MTDFLIYLGKVALAISLIWLAYQLLLRKNTHFTWARMYLLGGMLGSLLLPFWEPSTDWVSFTISSTGIEPQSDAALVAEASGFAERFDWSFWLGGVYLFGLGLMLIRAVLIQFQIRRLRVNATAERSSDYTILRSDQIKAPFSFRRFIFLPEGLSEAESEIIIAHERAHIQERHSGDAVLMELFLLLQWFNPFAWRYKRSLLTLHEYLADRHTLAQGIDKSRYQLLLLKQSAGQKVFALANAFNQVTSINRIQMMNQNRSTRWSRLTFLLLLPLLGLSLYSFQILPQDDVLILETDEGILVKGQVFAATDHSPIAGAAILVEDTKVGTFSDKEGKFLLKIPTGSPATLAFSYVGMTTHRLKMERSGVVTVFMASTEANSTHTVSTATVKLTPEEADKVKPAKRPLMVVDGVITDQSFDKESIDPANIESVEVLKGESATAIYGEKGRNGVVIIKTKKQ
ncbi:MAG: carboxypeptidase-like regulatory domain-containing protein [Bacteroidota bacterium]